MKGPMRVVVGLSEQLTCGHHVPLMKPLRFASTRTGGPWSGRAQVFVHASRRCAECATTPAEIETLASATVARLEAVSSLLDEHIRRLEIS